MMSTDPESVRKQNEPSMIWIIEDDPLLNNVIHRSLQKSGFTCRIFFSGTELLDFINQQENIYHNKPILLLDFLLEDMNAIELITSMQQMEICYPFVIMTGFGDEKTAVELMKLGAIDYVVKESFFVEKIVKVLRQATDKIETLRKLDQSRLELEENAHQLKLLNAQINLQKRAIEDEKAKSDKLLQTVLPRKIARELLEKGYTKPRQFSNVSILFADVIGFSDLAKITDPIELVSRLDNYFYIFDEIVEQFGLEKIKTIGDCYMCAGGIPEEHPQNAVITVLAGLKIQDTIERLKYEYNRKDELEFRLRLGIHTGEVVAGVVGKIKFAYDIWGDAVNIASRIVEAGEKDKVNVSEKTFMLISDFFHFTTRGNVITKRNYPMQMYFVERLKPEFSADDKGIVPNERLMSMLNLRQGVKYY
jgi:class 3 adenylate cyclase